jgi:hypothetical protein
MFFIIAFFLFFGTPEAHAKDQGTASDYPTSIIPRTKIQKHFDLDDNKILNLYEMSLLRTHIRFGYTLVQKKKQIPSDINHNAMLETDEEAIYASDKKNGTLRPHVSAKKLAKNKLKLIKKSQSSPL